MIVLVDIGNTRTKLIKSFGAKLTDLLSIENEKLSSQLIVDYFDGALEVIVASVNSVDLNRLIDHAATELSIPCQFIKTAATAFGVKNSYQVFENLGVDRWLAILGAAKLFPNQNVLVIDSGTATTIDLLNEAGQHLGGWITPGIDLMHQSLQINTENINSQKQTHVSTTFGKDTAECVDNGCWAVLAATIERAVKQAETEYSAIDQVVLTGGNCKIIAPHLSVQTVLEPDLIFVGLRRYQRS